MASELCTWIESQFSEGSVLVPDAVHVEQRNIVEDALEQLLQCQHVYEFGRKSLNPKPGTHVAASPLIGEETMLKAVAAAARAVGTSLNQIVPFSRAASCSPPSGSSPTAIPTASLAAPAPAPVLSAEQLSELELARQRAVRAAAGRRQQLISQKRARQVQREATVSTAVAPAQPGSDGSRRPQRSTGKAAGSPIAKRARRAAAGGVAAVTDALQSDEDDDTHDDEEDDDKFAAAMRPGDSSQDARRLKRLLRNRVSAQLARERKKQYVTDLEAQVEAANKRIRELESSLRDSLEQNDALRRVVHSMTGEASMSSNCNPTAANAATAAAANAVLPLPHPQAAALNKCGNTVLSPDCDAPQRSPFACVTANTALHPVAVSHLHDVTSVDDRSDAFKQVNVAYDVATRNTLLAQAVGHTSVPPSTTTTATPPSQHNMLVAGIEAVSCPGHLGSLNLDILEQELDRAEAAAGASGGTGDDQHVGAGMVTGRHDEEEEEEECGNRLLVPQVASPSGLTAMHAQGDVPAQAAYGHHVACLTMSLDLGPADSLGLDL